MWDAGRYQECRLGSGSDGPSGSLPTVQTWLLFDGVIDKGDDEGDGRSRLAREFDASNIEWRYCLGTRQRIFISPLLRH